MSRRFLVGGPPNSGKSTYTLSATQRLASGFGRSTRAVELDVWSLSYPAFEGKVPFKGRPKNTGLDWDWQGALLARLKEFNEAKELFVLGDLPGRARDNGILDFICANARVDGAIVISRTLEDIKLWRDAFEKLGVKMFLECLTLQGGGMPLILRDMARAVDSAHPDVALLADRITASSDDECRARAMDERFLSIFKANYARRSRTVHGRDENLEGPLKKPLMAAGDELKKLAQRNGLRLAEDVLATPRPASWSAAIFREHCERWFKIANDGIYDPAWYDPEIAELKNDAAKIERARGVPVRINPCYRIWTPEHTLLKVPPFLLEDEMDGFYGRLAELATLAATHFPSWNDTIDVMAYADLMIDGELRPWLDGCGRVAVALVMWLSRTLGSPPPLFAANKAVHKMTIRDLDRHRLYFLHSIRCAELEHP